MPGYIDSYIHGNRIGVLVELKCADDFALKTPQFRALAKMRADEVLPIPRGPTKR